MTRPSSRPRRAGRTAVGLAILALVTAACAAPDSAAPQAEGRSFADIRAAADGQTVSLWMYGGDEQGNAYVDDILAPAAAEQGVTLRRVPVADTADAVNRILSERQAGVTDGDVDLVWINGENFATGRQAGAWLCGWTGMLPNMAGTDPDDPLLTTDFGTPVDGCEAPWHKAQFTLVYDSAAVPDPPTTLQGVLDWARANPGRFTYPAPPDFTGSAFLRQVLYGVSGGPEDVPLTYSQDAYDELTPRLFDTLADLAPFLWRGGDTYPQTGEQLNQLFADGEVDMTMTYGPATLPDLVADGTYPPTTRVLTLDEGTLGNASFLAIPSTSGDQEGAMVVADLALSADQQLAKARPEVWGQFTVLDLSRLDAGDRAAFEQLPAAVVPPYEELSRGADPELSAEWVPRLEEGWRQTVLAANP
ncbi:ABC transporter substrate-binding protein [Modestobacter caceresii]|uniref:ABC transporter substrate-binding protein n=1 Tax=Modestobacter caceresii TaxID=1522368 RepID=A0A098Y6N7_9ACTN|nr:ABC transporter substrate-binding protein [Modestobacter caceresii]KGH45341.1 ABC transporter substrate-binding protein [Modestobacter caceresii]